MANMDCYIELALEVSYDYTPAFPAPRGEPPEGDELEITAVILRNIHSLVKTDVQAYLTPKEISMLEEQIISNLPGPDDWD